MENDCLGLIKGDHWIYCNDEYIIITGKCLWILNKNGTLVARRPDISHTYKVAFLSGNRVLLAHGKNDSYRLISLKDGTDIWRASQLKVDLPYKGFAISSDESFAYDYYNLRTQYMFSRINLSNGNTNVYKIRQGLRATHDIMCDENNVPCLLQTQYDEVSDNIINQNGVLLLSLSSIGSYKEANWKYRWKYNGQTTSCFFLDNVNTILTNDLQVVNLQTGEMYFLLENEKTWVAPGPRPTDCWFDESKRYIILKYHTVNVVVDRITRTMIARYIGDTARGCIIGDEYWIASSEGIRCLPFPTIEDVPVKKHFFWKPGL